MVNMDALILGQGYTQPQLAEIWGYKSYDAIRRGIVTPSGQNIIILFVTYEKVSYATQYKDEIQGNILYMMGQEKHGTDSRLMQNLQSIQDEIHLFYRDVHHTPFKYLGKCRLIAAKENIDGPSEFEFLLLNVGESEDSIFDVLANLPENETHDISEALEGTKKVIQHIKYERNPLNRREAIRVHGSVCKICGFDFNATYGKDLANNYIEIHHLKPLSEGEQSVNPVRDLIPVCSNCHRMLHRRRSGNVSPLELSELFVARSK